MFCVDVPRLSLASNLEQAKLDIKAREAFANDLKDMLQEFIDMGILMMKIMKMRRMNKC